MTIHHLFQILYFYQKLEHYCHECHTILSLFFSTKRPVHYLYWNLNQFENYFPKSNTYCFINFWGDCPGLLITLVLPCPALSNHLSPSFSDAHPFFTLFSSAPPFFITQHFSSDPRAAPGGMGAEQFDRRINGSKFFEALMNCEY